MFWHRIRKSSSSCMKWTFVSLSSSSWSLTREASALTLTSKIPECDVGTDIISEIIIILWPFSFHKINFKTWNMGPLKNSDILIAWKREGTTTGNQRFCTACPSMKCFSGDPSNVLIPVSRKRKLKSDFTNCLLNHPGLCFSILKIISKATTGSPRDLLSRKFLSTCNNLSRGSSIQKLAGIRVNVLYTRKTIYYNNLNYKLVKLV